MNNRNINDHLFALTVEDIASILGISRTGAYNLFRSKDFPTLRIGKRMVCPRYKFEEWMEKSIESHKEGRIINHAR